MRTSVVLTNALWPVGHVLGGACPVYRWEEEQVRRGATRPNAITSSTGSNPIAGLASRNASLGANAMTSLNGGVFGGAGREGRVGGERPHFMGVDEMQKALREAEKRLRESHERNERQLQMVRFFSGEGKGKKCRKFIENFYICVNIGAFWHFFNFKKDSRKMSSRSTLSL